MCPLIQDVAKFRLQCEKYKMDFFPELLGVGILRGEADHVTLTLEVKDQGQAAMGEGAGVS